MDLSNSMGDDKASVEKLGAKLVDTMRNITRFFSMGFGSFVDKHAYPYGWYNYNLRFKHTDIFFSMKISLIDRPQETTYSFKNHMRIDDNLALFTVINLWQINIVYSKQLNKFSRAKWNGQELSARTTSLKVDSKLSSKPLCVKRKSDGEKKPDTSFY